MLKSTLLYRCKCENPFGELGNGIKRTVFRPWVVLVRNVDEEQVKTINVREDKHRHEKHKDRE